MLAGIDLVLPAVDPVQLATWMRGISRRCLAHAVAIADDQNQSTDMRLRAINVIANQGWLKSDVGASMVVQINNLNSAEPAAASMPQDRLRELLARLNGTQPVLDVQDVAAKRSIVD